MNIKVWKKLSYKSKLEYFNICKTIYKNKHDKIRTIIKIKGEYTNV